MSAGWDLGSEFAVGLDLIISTLERTLAEAS
jgi:hypothetical protein